ncbi:mitochondrial ATPase expression-domain-containing protein [Xylariomycetidae sp. FL0641]|nr:mitochondrial ATPase expression-domain-containing protein [Xylariomycetidae sp. FL0641]
MFGVSAVRDLGGHCASQAGVLSRPPRGTSSRLLSVRLYRCFQTGRSPRPHLPPTAPLSTSRRLQPHLARCATTASEPRLLSDEDLAYAQALLQRYGQPGRAGESAQVDQAGKVIQQAPGRQLRSASARSSRRATPEPPPDPQYIQNQLPSPFTSILEALAEQDTRKLMFHLYTITRMDPDQVRECILILPRTTITEIFRSLDPLTVYRNADTTGFNFIAPGMYRMLNLGSLVDDWGVRRLYAKLLKRLQFLAEALEAAGYSLLLEEHSCLLRCAGAASKPAQAIAVWRRMDQHGIQAWRNSQSYSDFIAARFMTESLFWGYDKLKRHVTPRNLHRSRLRLTPRRVYRLDRLNLSLGAYRFRFGMDKDIKDHSEHLMRVLRGGTPVKRLLRYMYGAGMKVNDQILCSIMVALGRSGSLGMINQGILAQEYGIQIKRVVADDGVQSFQVTSVVLQDQQYRPRTHVRPSVRLLRAIVEVYGSNGEISAAMALIEYISSQHKVPIPADVWIDLMEWTYVMGSNQVKGAWERAGLTSKIPHPLAVQDIWTAMRYHPTYPVSKPPFKALYMMAAKHLSANSSRRRRDALPYIRSAANVYYAEEAAYEHAVYASVRADRDGVGAAAARLVLQRTRLRKNVMWYQMRELVRRLLKTAHKLNRFENPCEDPIPTPAVPKWIAEFRPFLDNPLRYRTPTGEVQLDDYALDTPRSRLLGSAIAVMVPIARPEVQRDGSIENRTVLVRRSRKRLHLFSRRSLQPIRKAGHAGPLALLMGSDDAFRWKMEGPLTRRRRPGTEAVGPGQWAKAEEERRRRMEKERQGLYDEDLL